MTTGDPRGAATPPRPEPPDVPAELDLSRRRPRRRPPAQSDIRGINTIASLPAAAAGGGREDEPADRRAGASGAGPGEDGRAAHPDDRADSRG